MIRRLAEALLALAGLLLAGAVCAQASSSDPSLEELLQRSLPGAARHAQVSTASRFAQSADRAPALTYLVTAEDIRNFGYRNLGDILNSLPGLYLTSNGNFTFIGTRGLGRPGDFNSRLLVLIDGMRVNENIYDAAQVGPEFQLDAALIERVEFTPGPGSALYGNNAFFGVIQVFTKRVDKLAGPQLGVSVGSNRYFRAHASYGQRLEQGGDWWLALSAFNQSHMPLMAPVQPALDPEVLRHHQWDRGQKLALGWSQGAFNLHAGLAERRLGLPSVTGVDTPVYLQALDLTRLSYLAVQYEGSIGADWDWELRASTQRSLYHRDTPFLDEDEQEHVFRSRALGRWNGAELKLATQRWEGQRWIAGLEVQHDLIQRITHGATGWPPLQETWGTDRRMGLYLQDELSLSETQQVVLGWRYDKSRSAGSSSNPRLAWVWRPTESASLKLLHGSAYRGANLFEFDVNFARELPLPVPERTRSTELAWEQALDGGLHYSLAISQAQLRDLITLNDDIFGFDNRDRVRSRGLDIGVEQRWAGGAQLAGTLSLQHSRDQFGQRLSNSPTALLKARWLQPLAADWQLGWQMLAMSQREVNGGRLGGYAVHHLNLLWKMKPDAELAFGLYNAFDKRYYDRTDPVGPPLRQEGRNLRVSLSRRWQ